MAIEHNIYPLTVTADRYSGTYSGHAFTAWNLDPHDVPAEIGADDVTCQVFWEKNRIPFGGGRTIDESVDSLYFKLQQEELNA